MDYEFFESITDKEAHEIYDEFLACGRKNEAQFVELLQADGLKGDFSITSIAPTIIWGAARTTMVNETMGNEQPWWIRQAHHGVYRRFTAESKPVILACAYYLGESFIRAFPSLSWDLGDSNTMVARMPVIRGFEHDMELPPMIVVKHAFSHIHENDPQQDPQLMVDSWKKNVPPVTAST